jgi:integrase
MINPELTKTVKIESAGGLSVDLATPFRQALECSPNCFAFTQRRLEQLSLPASKVTYYNDSKTRGLQLKVYPSGTKTFCLHKKVDGRADRITIGAFSDFTVREARAKAQELSVGIAHGKNPSRERAAIRDEMTLGELFDAYLEGYGKTHKKTWANDVSMFNRHLHAFALRRISEITKDDLTKLHRRIGRHARYAANRVIELVSSIYNWALGETTWEGENPAVGIRAFPEEKRERFLDAEELPRFFRSLAEEPNPILRDFFLSLILTGARRSNVESMQWSEIRWGRQVWEIPASKSKSGKILNVQLAPLMLGLLEYRRDSVDVDPVFVFPGTGKTGHLVEPKSAWQRILQRAGLSDVHMHDLRRTLGSWQAINGSSLAIIGASLGHQSLEATKVYARLSADPVRASVVNATNAIFESAPAGLLPPVKTNGRE